MVKYIEWDVAMQFVYDACTECMESCEEFDGIYPDCHKCPIEGVKLKLRHTIAADVRPVVLCRDCIYYVESEEVNGEKMCVKDANWSIVDGGYYGFTDYPTPEWFCADGKKREESNG